MSTIYLDTLDECLLARIVKKFNTVRSGSRFYRSCKGARDFVERIKPVWPLPDSALRYDTEGASLSTNRRIWIPGSWSKFPLQFCRLHLYVWTPSDEFIKTTVIPELETVGAVKRIFPVSRERLLSDETMKSLMTAAQPETVVVQGYLYDPASAVFKGVKNLKCYAYEMEEGGMFYLKTKSIFKLMVNRKKIKWHCNRLDKNAVIRFLENWLKGEATDSLEKLACMAADMPVIENKDVEEILNHPNIQSLMKSCIREGDDWIVERAGAGRLRIRFMWKTIDFFFS